MMKSLRHGVWLMALLAWIWPLTLPLFDSYDGLGYLVPSLSAVDDGDLFYADEYSAYGMPEPLARPTPTGMYGNHWNVGLALVFLPTYATLRAMGVPEGPCPAVLAAFHSMALAFAAIAFATMFELARRRLESLHVEHARTAALTIAMACYFGTPLFFYAHAASVHPHAFEAALAGLFVGAAVRYHDQPSSDLALAMGVSLAGAFLIRSQAAPLVLLPMASLARSLVTGRWRERSIREWSVDAACSIGPVLAAMTIASTYDDIIWGVSGGSLRSALFDAMPSLWRSLVHPYHGLFAWSPVLVLATLGLVLLVRRDPWLFAGCMGVLLVELYLNGTSYDHIIDAPKYSRHWGGGASFGARRWCCTIPLFVLGAAEFVAVGRSAWMRSLTVAMASLSCLWSINLGLYGRFAPGTVLARPLDAERLFAIAGDGVRFLPRSLGWLVETVPTVLVAGPGFVVVAVQTLVVTVVVIGLRKLPATRRTWALAWIAAVVAVAALLTLRTLGEASTRTAIREAEAIERSRLELASRKAQVQYHVWIHQARLRSATGEPEFALLTYERAFRLGYGRDTLAEYFALVKDEPRELRLARVHRLQATSGSHPFLDEVLAELGP